MIIREADMRGQAPDAMAQAREQMTAGLRESAAEFERVWLWWMRRARALSILAGWVPPTARELWWDAYEDDALAYAAEFEPD